MPLVSTGFPAAHAASGPPWVGDSKTACAYTSESTSALQNLSTLTGRPIDCALIFSDLTDDWSTWEQPWEIRTNMPDAQWAPWLAAKPGRRLVVTQALVPNGLPSDWRAQGASGAYDDHIKAWAANMVNAGFGSATIRLGHEANGDWYFDNIGNTPADYASWAAYWNRFVHIARSVPGADFTFDWTVNAGYREIPFSAYYPGDDAVDIIGIDQYDGMAIAPHPMPATPQAHWTALAAQPWGLNALVAFAASHGKPLSIPEWGVLTAGSANGTGLGDDPTFVDGIARTVRDNPTSYESVWDTTSPTSPTATAIEDSPSSLAEYRNQFGAGGAALTGGAAPRTNAPTNSTPTGLVATYIVAQPSARLIRLGTLVRIHAQLVGGGHALIGQRLILERLVGKHWSVVSHATTGSEGRATLTYKAAGAALYRVRFTAAAGRAASASTVMTVKTTKPKKRKG